MTETFTASLLLHSSRAFHRTFVAMKSQINFSFCPVLLASLGSHRPDSQGNPQETASTESALSESLCHEGQPRTSYWTLDFNKCILHFSNQHCTVCTFTICLVLCLTFAVVIAVLPLLFSTLMKFCYFNVLPCGDQFCMPAVRALTKSRETAIPKQAMNY